MSVGGALLGSAWAMAFRETASHNNLPTFTVARNRSSLVALIEYRRQRLLLLDSSDVASIRSLTELVTGFMKQRIDVLIGTSAALAELPGDFAHRWMIDSMYGLPDTEIESAISLNGRELRIDELGIVCDRVPVGEWKNHAPRGESPWWLAVRYRDSQILVASQATLPGRLPVRARAATCIVCNDLEAPSVAATIPAAALALPSDAVLEQPFHTGSAPIIVPLYPETPQTFVLTEGALELPDAH